MWRTPDDGIHVLSLPDWSPLFTSDAIDSVRRVLAHMDDGAIGELIEDLEAGTIDEMDPAPLDPESEAQYENQVPADGIFSAMVADATGLHAAVAGIP